MITVLKESEIAPNIPEAVSSGRWYVFCPGCYENAKKSLPNENERVWLNAALHCFSEKVHRFNGDVEKPTLSPSLLLWHSEGEGIAQKVYCCHSFVVDGIMQYLNDCSHEMRGCNVKLLDAQRYLDANALSAPASVPTAWLPEAISECAKQIADWGLTAYLREGQHDLLGEGDPITVHIHLARDFSKYPGGRFKDDGPHSAEHLRDDLIVPVLSRGNHVCLHLDGTYGFCSSFLEEAFGGLVRRGYDAQTLRRVLSLETTHAAYVAKVWNYIDFADAMARAGGPNEIAPSTAGAQSG